MNEVEIDDNEENIIKDLKEIEISANELSKKHTNYFEFIEFFNNFVSKIENK